MNDVRGSEMGKSKPSAREIEFARLLAKMTAEEIDELYGLVLVKRSKRGKANCERISTLRRWECAKPIIIGERRSVTEPVVLERRIAD